MPNRQLAYHPRFIANFEIDIATPFNANATKTVEFDDDELKGVKPDMVLSAQVDGDSGAIAIGASCSDEDEVTVVFRNDGATGAKNDLNLTIIGF